jgi:hypothetical protein
MDPPLPDNLKTSVTKIFNDIYLHSAAESMQILILEPTQQSM